MNARTAMVLPDMQLMLPRFVVEISRGKDLKLSADQTKY